MSAPIDLDRIVGKMKRYTRIPEEEIKIIVTVCNQWGDSGKGKISDLLAPWADVNGRGTGGHNAGHTTVRNGKVKIFHLLPVGIEYDRLGKVTVLGSGMVILPAALCGELDELDQEGLPYDNLMVSADAHVITSYHIKRDQDKNQSMAQGGIGSTGRGIGPCYEDQTGRRGIRIADLFDTDHLVGLIKKAVPFYPEQQVDVDQVVAELIEHRERIRPLVRNTTAEMHRFVREGKKIHVEGAQGLLLSVKHGTYRYVTSSDCSLDGTMAGVGLSAYMVDLPLGIVKFPFMTRVGGGPFPTELGGAASEQYCASKDPEHKLLWELDHYGIPHTMNNGRVKYDHNHPIILGLVNSIDPFLQGHGLRLAAEEYGATTQRPRRTGWIDAVAAKYAVGINGPLMVLTKPDCLAGAEEFKVAYGYKDRGEVVQDFDRDCSFLRRVQPEFKTYKGYGDIQDVKVYDELPGSLREATQDLEQFTGGRVVMVSNGPDTEQIIVKEG